MLLFRCTIARRFYYLYYISGADFFLLDSSLRNCLISLLSQFQLLVRFLRHCFWLFLFEFRLRVVCACDLAMAPNQSIVRFNLSMFTLFDDKSNVILSMDIEFQAITLPTTRIYKGKW